MPLNQVVTPYDDAGYPAVARITAVLTFAGGVVKAAPGRLIRVIVTTAFVGATGQLEFYDNSTGAATGTPLLTIPVAAGLAGAVFVADLPALTGISAVNTGGTLSAGAVTVGYS
jgi:hypothetical protein